MTAPAPDRLRALEAEVAESGWGRSSRRREALLRESARDLAAAASSAGAQDWLAALGLGEVRDRRGTSRGRRGPSATPGTSALRRRVVRALDVHTGPRPAASLPQVAVVACDAALGPGAALAEAATHLAAGLGVLVLTPPELAPLGHGFESVAAQLGVPLAWDPFPAAASSAVDAAVEVTDRAGAARWSVTARPRDRARAAARLASAALRGGAPFGAGVRPGLQPEARVVELRTGSAWVGPEDDLLRAARRVARAAFGRGSAGGFLAESVGAVEVHPLVFSEFHDVLLEVLEAHEGPVPALHCVRLGAFRAAFDRAFRLALDEGATLLHSAALERDEDARPRFARAVFTNVDPTTRTARELEPVGILRILRAEARGSLLAPRRTAPSNDTHRT